MTRATRGGLAVGLLTLVVTSSGCSVFGLNQFDDFGDWYVGPAGYGAALDGRKSDVSLDVERPAVYGHFRLPEILFQPAGGWKYPPRRTLTNESLIEAMAAAMEAQNQANAQARTYGYGVGTASYTRTTVYEPGSRNALQFDWFDAGLVEIVPYRVWAAEERGPVYKVGMTLLQPLNTMMNAFGAFARAPIYATHDALKTAMIPVAGAYYAVRGEAGDETDTLASARTPGGSGGVR